MANINLTDAVIRALEPPLAGSRSTSDAGVRGLGARVTSTGRRAFVFIYYVRGTGVQRKYTVGDATAWTVEMAREKALELRRLVDVGGDPMDVHAHRRGRQPNKLLAIAENGNAALAGAAPTLDQGYHPPTQPTPRGKYTDERHRPQALFGAGPGQFSLDQELKTYVETTG